MDVFKTRVGDWHSIPISNENFAKYTGMREPYVHEHDCEQGHGRDGLRSYFAVCPECDNPIQLIGLYANQEDSKNEPYGRHVKHSIRYLARYDEDEYYACPYADPRYHRNPGRRPANSPKGAALRALMRDRFDLIVWDWEHSTGIHMSVDYATRMLDGWRANDGWRYYAATWSNLPWMLFFGAPAQTLVGRWIRKDSDLRRKLEALDCVRLEDVSPWYMRVTKASRAYVDLSFMLWKRRITVEDEHAYETYRLRVLLDGKPVGEDLTVHADASYLNDAPRRRNQRMLEESESVLG